MATTTRSTHAAARTGTQGLAWAVLVASVLEVVAPVVTISGPGASPAQGSGPELLITPVGWAFSIWGVIYTLAIVQAVATLVRGPGAVPRRLQVDLVVLYLGGALWILLAALDSSIATALALLLMLVAAVDAVLTAARSSFEPGWFAVLTRAAVGLFAGWVTAAFFLNLSTALVDLEVVSAQSVGWQLGVLAVAAVALLAVLVRTGGNVAYAAAAAWAMLGIAVTGRADGTTSVLVAAAVAGVAIVLTAAGLLARRRV
jgi:multisubunit Na+/H+ antiporter MnhF subunit